MNKNDIKSLLDCVKDGSLSVDDALGRLRHMPYENISFAMLDHHRHLRSGIMEVVYAEGKQKHEVITIAKHIYDQSGKLFITRASEEIFYDIGIKDAVYHQKSRIIEAGGVSEKTGNILVITAGTSDIKIAEEASVTASFLGSNVTNLYDIGVAGLHRVLNNLNIIETAKVIIVAAGMEGALPSVIGGITDKPVIAVPTSVGYGTSLGGMTALFAMLNSCVPGIAVMNIDNGFGAGCLAHKINIIHEGFSSMGLKHPQGDESP
jgi:hypothetical protein